MTSSAKTITVLATFGVLLLFLFPASFGSFTSTHGPTTAMRSLTAIRNLFAALASAAILALLKGGSQFFVPQSIQVTIQKIDSTTLCMRC